MEVAMETGTLKELNVKPGDVVECVEIGASIFTYGRHYVITNLGGVIDDEGDDWMYRFGANPITVTFRIISRAAQAAPDLTAIKTRNILAKQIIGKVEVMNNGKVWMQHTESATEMRAAAETLNRMADMLEPRQ